jgi:uncharacterized membrane protein YhaH (DUF805 family)
MNSPSIGKEGVAMNWYLAVLRNFAVFNGRARMKEYWVYFLVSAVIYLILLVAGGPIGAAAASLYGLATLLPSIAVGVRRLHDTERSGWWYLLIFIPIAGAIVLIVFLALEGTVGANSYGEDPRHAPEPPGWKDLRWSDVKAGMTSASPPPNDTLAQLERLARLREQGALTEAEFQAQKAKILAD